jgi:hypothetical protein
VGEKDDRAAACLLEFRNQPIIQGVIKQVQYFGRFSFSAKIAYKGFFVFLDSLGANSKEAVSVHIVALCPYTGIWNISRKKLGEPILAILHDPGLVSMAI